MTKRTFEATGLRRRNLAFEGQKEPHELSPGEEVDAKCPFIVNCDERGFLPATIVRKVHNHAMNDDIYVVKWRLQDLMQLPIYSHLYLRLVEGVSFPDDSPYVEDDTIKSTAKVTSFLILENTTLFILIQPLKLLIGALSDLIYAA